MTYSWYNIRKDYGNNRIKYTHNKGLNWETISFTDEMNSYSDINDYIHQYMKQKNHHSTDPKGQTQLQINLTFVLSTLSVLITFIDDEYWFDLRGSDFGDLIEFEKKILTKTEYGAKLLNITNSIYVLNINTSAIKNSIVDELILLLSYQQIILLDLTHLLLNREDLIIFSCFIK